MKENGGSNHTTNEMLHVFMNYLSSTWVWFVHENLVVLAYDCGTKAHMGTENDPHTLHHSIYGVPLHSLSDLSLYIDIHIQDAKGNNTASVYIPTSSTEMRVEWMVLYVLNTHNDAQFHGCH